MLNRYHWALNSGVPLPSCEGRPKGDSYFTDLFLLLSHIEQVKSPLPLHASPIMHTSPSHTSPIACVYMCTHTHAHFSFPAFPSCLPHNQETCWPHGLHSFNMLLMNCDLMPHHHVLGLPPSASPIPFLLLTPKDLLRLYLP